LQDRKALAVAVDPAQHGGARWAAQLWSEQGPVGFLLLGARADDSLYSEEELEIARAGGERLIDAAAGLALSQRLMQLQRERMTAAQLADQRTRRVLHDEVLPLIHTAMLTISGDPDRKSALQRLSEAHGQISALLRDLPAATTSNVEHLGPLAALRKAVEDESRQAFSSVTWAVDEEAERAVRSLPALKAETLYYAGRELVRNAARHARPEDRGPLHLTILATYRSGRLCVTIQDNGTGPLLGNPARGHGLDLHTTLLAIVGGTLIVESLPQVGTRGILTLPIATEVV
jgi:signal transduction histidine kinase